QWRRDGSAISGATSATYTTTAKDLGKRITVSVTAAEYGWLSSVTTSAATEKMGRYPLEGTLSVVVSKDDATKKLTANVSGLTTPGVIYKYQWLRDGKSITSKGTSATYALTSSDFGKLISVRVTATKTDYTSVVRTTGGVSHSVLP